ncbi:MAG: hypothetical protein M5U28_23780 [Sandaracinaceae bacterium]|nr:hypothetical protein [Sandaracinaceae bacterium]
MIDAADHTVRASRWLFAASCDRGNDMRPSLSVSDPDADGRPELLVEHAVRPIRRDLFDGGSETGMLKYVLDAETLRTQLALMTDVLRHEGSGDHTECYGDFDLVDLDGDPHPDVEVEVACESRRAARERERPRRRTHRRRCRYRADVDAWASCDVAQWLFPGHDATGIAVETPADLRAAMPGLGSETAAVVELYRRQIEREAEE